MPEQNQTDSSPRPDAEALRKVWHSMVLSRKTDERLVRLYHQGRINGGVYVGIGQEAIGATAAAATGPLDLLAPAIRNMSLHIGRGETILNIFRQWLGRATGPTRGRDGNIHHGNADNGVLHMISHLGAMLPVVTGGVMARRMRGIPSIGVSIIGDGASSTGDFHEGINFAAVRKVPLVVIVEHNHFAYSTPSSLQYRCERLIDRAPGYGIEGISADGNDAAALMQLFSSLFADVREHPRTVLVECDTMRMRGHGEHDDFSYVPRDLIDTYRKRDPILVLRQFLIDNGISTAEELSRSEAACEAEVEQACATAMAEPAPDPATLCEGVYANG